VLSFPLPEGAFRRPLHHGIERGKRLAGEKTVRGAVIGDCQHEPIDEDIQRILADVDQELLSLDLVRRGEPEPSLAGEHELGALAGQRRSRHEDTPLDLQDSRRESELQLLHGDGTVPVQGPSPERIREGRQVIAGESELCRGDEHEQTDTGQKPHEAPPGGSTTTGSGYLSQSVR
jgi:hypothetical protein